jgi:hypothetical protein
MAGLQYPRELVATLYDELGARPDASAVELRQAYRRRARQIHPDLRPGDDGAAAEAMSRLNNAYRVLSDPDERRRYDLELALAAARVRAERMVAEGRVNGSGRPPTTVQDVDDDGREIRFRPRLWIVVLAVLAVIFVFTAYAAGRPVSKPPAGTAGQCLPITGSDKYVPCTQPNIGKLVTEVTPDQACPEGSFRHIIQSRNVVACLTNH